MKRINLPPLYLFAAIALMLLLHFYLPLMRIVAPPYSYMGILIIITGITLISWNALYFKKYDTPIRVFQHPTHLITDGLYRYSRNPIYLGMAIIVAGGAVTLGSIAPFFVIPLFVVMIQRNFIEKEERLLENIFGNKYLDYKNRVRRWL